MKQFHKRKIGFTVCIGRWAFLLFLAFLTGSVACNPAIHAAVSQRELAKMAR